MRTLLVLAAVTAFCATLVQGEEVLRTVEWTKVPAGAGFTAELKQSPDGTTAMHVTSAGAPVTVTLATIEDPAIGTERYALHGQVRYRDVEGEGYLEMLSYCGDGGPHFSRTVADSGPAKHLQGTSGWRRFVLPFQLNGSPPPRKLELNLVLPGSGSVTVGPVRLVAYGPGEDPLAAPGQWFGGRGAGLVGGIGGTLVGLLGALIGWLCSRGAARNLVIALLRLMLLIGLACLAVAFFALLRGQPFTVWYPCGLLGVVCTVVPLGLMRTVRTRYQAEEMRKMQAMDAG